MVNLSLLKENIKGVIIAIVVGALVIMIPKVFPAAWPAYKFITSPILDPLLAALLIGILVRFFIKFSDKSIAGFKLTPMLFIPLGVIFYGAVNLNFVKFGTVDPMSIFIIIFVFLAYSTFIYFLSTVFNIDSKTTYLITTGSVICGASAITIASDAVDAEPDQVSKSLISVFITALFALFVAFPLIVLIFKMTGMDYTIMSGALMQFTGLVKAAVMNHTGDKNLADLGVSIKAIRYIFLLILIPLFSSFVKGKFHTPWYLWGFLAAGLLFSFFPSLVKSLNPILKPALDYLWGVSLAAIGLNANLKVLFSKDGMKTLLVSLISFLFAVFIFLALYIPLKGLTL